MSKTQPTYAKEFKQEAVKLFETSEKSKTQIARDLGISDSALSKWCKEFGNLGKEAFPGKGHQTAIEEENRKLRREVADRYDIHCHKRGVALPMPGVLDVYSRKLIGWAMSMMQDW